MSGRGAVLALLAFGAVVAAAVDARAHQFAPSLLEIVESEAGHASVRWKQPRVRVMGSELRPVLPVDCEPDGEFTVSEEGTGMAARWEITCPGSLVGLTLGVDGLSGSKADALLRVSLADGRSFRHVLTADRDRFVVPERESRLGVLRGYGTLGIEHILTGWDHLLFVLGLVLLVGWGRNLLWTITAFTLGHSVTLVLASLGLVRVPQAPIEAAIAFSIYFLAVELTRKGGERPPLMERQPWLLAAGFGLLHGLGFAGALAEVGLPQGEIPLALLAFNVGIELGQLAFVAVALIAIAALRPLTQRLPAWSFAIPAYAIGGLAVFWFLQRLTGSLPPIL